MEVSQINISITLTDDKGQHQTVSFRPTIDAVKREPTQPVDLQGKIDQEPILDVSNLSDDEFRTWIGYDANKEKTG